MAKFPYPGASWRFQAFGRPSKDVHHPPIQLDSASQDGPTVFDELVVDGWFHMEAMDRREWWMQIGPLTVNIRVMADGRHDVIVEDEELGELVARYKRGKRVDG